MACLIKGQSIACTQKSRAHYLEGPENEKITVCEVSGFATQKADEALSMLELSAKGTKCKKPVYSAKINPETDRLWTLEEWQQAIEKLEENLGLTGHSRVVVEHTKKGRIHRHVLWSRFHPDGGAAKNMGNDYAAHQKTQKEIQKAFHLRPMMVKGRDFKQWEVEWAKRYGFDVFKLRHQITKDFNGSKTGQSFKTALEAQGIVLCRGDKSQFVLILPWGQHKALSSMIMGRPTKAILRRALGDIDIAKLPTVQEGKAQVRANLPKIVPTKRRASTKAKGRTGKSGKTAHTYIRGGKGVKKGGAAYTRRTRLFTAKWGSKPPPQSWRPYGSFVTRHAGVALKPLTPINPLPRNGFTTGITTSNKLIASNFTHKTPAIGANGENSVQVQVRTTAQGQNIAPLENENTKPVAGGHASHCGTGVATPQPAGKLLKIGSALQPHVSASSTGGGFVLPPATLPFRGIGWMHLSRVARHPTEERQQPSAPFRPASGKQMSAAQEADLNAVYLGLMSWAEYCRKWGVGDGPTL